MKLGGNTGLGELVGHGHGAHETGDGLRVDRDHPFCRVRGNDDSPKLVGRRRAGYRGGVLIGSGIVATAALQRAQTPKKKNRVPNQEPATSGKRKLHVPLSSLS